MATTTAAPPTKILGLTADELSGYVMADSQFSNYGRSSISVSRSSSAKIIRDLTAAVGADGVEDRLIADGMGFLKARQSKDKSYNLFQGLVDQAKASAEEMDLVWLTPSFPRILTVFDNRAENIQSRTPTPVPPVFMVFGYNPNSDVNKLKPGHKFVAIVMAYLSFGEVDSKNIVGMSVRSRVMTAYINNALSGSFPHSEFSLQFLSPKVVVSKVSFQWLPDDKYGNETLYIDPTWFSDPRPDASAAPSPQRLRRAGNGMIILPTFNGDELDIKTWRKRLTDTTSPAWMKGVFVSNELFNRDTYSMEFSTKELARTIKLVNEQVPAVLKHASKLFPAEHKEALLKGDDASLRLLYKLARYMHSPDATTAPPGSQNTVTDGNIVAVEVR